MRYQLRDYRITPGEMERFVELWRSQVLPLRQRAGFTVVGAWWSAATERFVWIVAFDGDFEAADRAYYASPERTTMSPDPAELIVEARAEFVEQVDLG